MKDETIIETVDDYLNWYKKDAITIKDYNNYGYRGDGIHQQGIYFLLYKNIVVYVGMTGYNVYSRVSEHTQNKKFDLLKGWLIDFCELNQLKLINSESDLTILDDLNKDKVIFTIRSTSNFDGSVFFLNNKTFFKTNSYLERKVYKFLYGNKARFNPIKSK